MTSPVQRRHPAITDSHCFLLYFTLFASANLAHTSWMIEKVLKLGLQLFLFLSWLKQNAHNINFPGDEIFIYHQKYIFGSNFHSKPSAGMALDILAPSYVNVKVMDVWRVLRMNRWLLDGQPRCPTSPNIFWKWILIKMTHQSGQLFMKDEIKWDQKQLKAINLAVSFLSNCILKILIFN